MKRLSGMTGWLARLVASATVVLLSQHAFAAGTPAGTTITNQAQVDYAVGGAPQTFILSDPAGNSVPGGASPAQATAFVVDNRVDFTLVESGLIGHTVVTPGQTTGFVQFTLTNTGNAPQDFRLVASNLLAAFGPVNGLTDSEVDMNALQVFVDNDANGLDTGVDQAFVDELAQDGSVDIFIVGTADLTLVNGNVANVNVQATVADAGAAGLGADTIDDAGNTDTAAVEVVFAEGGALGDGVLEAQDGFTVSSAALTVSKTATLISDPFNGTGADRKAIPGAVVEYVITVSNATGANPADNVVISDTLSSDFTLVDDFFAPNGEVRIDNGGAVSTCSQESDGDNCQIVAGALSVGAITPLSVAATEILTITFRVTIN